MFRNAKVNADVLLASAVCPLMHRAIEIDGEAHWDVFVASLTRGVFYAITLSRALKTGLLWKVYSISTRLVLKSTNRSRGDFLLSVTYGAR